MLKLLNIFSLHGKYYDNNENRLTANVLFLLSESRHRFLKQFLHHLQIKFLPDELAKVQIDFQSCFPSEAGICIPDAVIQLADKLHVLVEAKIGVNALDLKQLRAYAQILRESETEQKRLVCITQVNDFLEFNSIVEEIEARILPKGTCVYLQWWQVLEIIRSTMYRSGSGKLSADQQVLKGKQLDYEERIATLFLQEVEQTMYDKKIIDEIPSGELNDIVVQTQTPWFMNVSKEHCVWFPSGSLPYGQRASRYVAYYEVDQEGNENRKKIAYIAKIKTVWNRISLGDARKLKEFGRLFGDPTINKEMTTWYKDNETFHIALTEVPIKLKNPIALGKKTTHARVLSKRRYSFIDLLNANSIDDLFS